MVDKNQQFPKALLVERRDVTDSLMVIKLRPEIAINFKPGQYCTLGLNGIERAYSIASSPHEGHLEIFLELVPKPEGVLTPLIWDMKLGDEITIRPRCKGIFTLDRKAQNHLMISTVTGVAPFVSMLRNAMHNGECEGNFYVLQGASYNDEFVYDEELKEMTESRSHSVTYIPTVSRPGEPQNRYWNGAVGRANEIAEEYVDRFELSVDDTLIYACGHPGMIEDVKIRFLPRGFKIKEERFWKE